ncbi:MAG: urease accessory protein UreF [Succinivibrio sp.]
MLSAVLTLISPNLPVGGFGYSQGLESAVETGLISSADGFREFLWHNLINSLSCSDLPLLERLYKSSSEEEFSLWTDRSVALRNTGEFRAEERDKGRALCRLIKDVYDHDEKYLLIAKSSYLSAFAYFAKINGISLDDMLESYFFSYTEAMCIAAVKLVPIGQTDAWRIIAGLTAKWPEVYKKVQSVQDEMIGSGLVNLSILSVRHESQYSRIFRS